MPTVATAAATSAVRASGDDAGDQGKKTTVDPTWRMTWRTSGGYCDATGAAGHVGGQLGRPGRRRGKVGHLVDHDEAAGGVVGEDGPERGAGNVRQRRRLAGAGDELGCLHDEAAGPQRPVELDPGGADGR